MSKNYSEENLVPVNKSDIKPGQLIIRIGADYFVGLAGSGSSQDVILGVTVDGGTTGCLFQKLSFTGTEASDSGAAVSMGDAIRTWNTGHPAPQPTPGGMDDLEFFDWMTILNNN